MAEKFGFRLSSPAGGEFPLAPEGERGLFTPPPPPCSAMRGGGGSVRPILEGGR